MQVIDKLLTLGAKHGRTGAPLKPEGLVIHWVGNPGSTAIANRNYFESGSGGNGVSAHYIVGLDGEIIQCVPENEQAMHAGKAYGRKYDGTARHNNSKYIGIENCHPDASGQFSVKTYNSLITLAAGICKRHNINPITHIFRHYDVTGKLCPLFYVNNESAWVNFIMAVNLKLKPPTLYRVRKSVNGAATQAGAFEIFSNAKMAADAKQGGYKVYDTGGYAVYNPATKVCVSSEEIGMLQKIVWCEARGEDLKGQTLVANVILNRVKHKNFPGTIKDVIFQPMQFQPTRDGSYEKAVPTNTNIEAVKAALDGVDYSEGAVFFCSLASAKNPKSWHESALTFLFEHKGHRFYI